jgi:hypothetical protein
MSGNINDISAKATIKTADYKLELMRTPAKSYKFYRHVNISLEDALDRLFRWL